MASYATWRVGTITVPSSTGSQSISNLGAMPDAVFFYGTNWLTEDSKVTASGHGVFRGMAAPKWDDAGTIVQNAACVIPTGDAHSQENVAIDMLDTSGGLSWLYVASLTSFDTTGFTLNWTTVTAGGYKVIYVALFNVDNVGGAVITDSSTLTLGWKAGASLLHTAWTGPSGNAAADRTQESYGGAAYPGNSGGSSWQGAGMTCNTFPTSISAQYDIGLEVNAPDTIIAHSVTFSGPFLQAQNILCYPTGGSLTDLLFDTNLADNSGMVVAWDDEDSWTDFGPMPVNTGNTGTVSGLSFPPGLVIGYTISDEPDGQSTGGRGAAGFSVITQGFQWCAISDNGMAYQSFQHGVCDVVAAGGVHTCDVELTNDGFILTCVDDDVAPDDWAWHAFGHPQFALWLPHIYRLVMFQGGGATITVDVVVGYLTQEDGYRIMLEDGSGALLL